MAVAKQKPQDNNNWNRIANYDTFKKWAYKSSPYRVIAHLGPRGHWKAVFTSVYGPTSYTIRGNLGADGKWEAVAAARQFMKENNYGCPPPGDYK